MGDWEKVFRENIGKYFNIVNSYLRDLFTLSHLSDFITIVGGYAFKSSEYQTTGIPIIRISDFNEETVHLNNVVHYKEDPSLSNFLLSEGDIIIALTGATIGKLGIVPTGLGKLYLNQRVGKFVIIDKDSFEKEYIYWLAKGIESKIKQLAWGAAQPNISPSTIAKMKVPIPPKVIQKGIIDFFHSLGKGKFDNKVYFDARTESRIKSLQSCFYAQKLIEIEINKQNKLLSQLRQSILQEAIEGKLTAEWRKNNPVIKGDPDYDAAALLEKIKEEKERLIKEGIIKREKPLPPIKPEEIPFPLPEGWVWTRLGEVALTIKRGISPLYSAKSHKKILNQKCVRLGYLDQSFAKTVEDHWEQSIDVSFRISNFDLLVNSTGDGTIGRCAIASINEEGLLFDSHILRVRFFTNHISSLYVQIINSGFVQDQIKKKKRATTTKQTELGVNNLSSFLFPLLGLKEISQLDFKLNQMFSVLVNSQKELQKQIDSIKLLKT